MFSSILGVHPLLGQKHPYLMVGCAFTTKKCLPTLPNTPGLEPLIYMNEVLLHFWLHLELKDLQNTSPNTPPPTFLPLYLTQLQTLTFLG